MLGGEQRAGAAEAGGDLVEDQQHFVAAADVPQIGQVTRVMKPHTARALHDGLHDHRGEFVGVLGQLRLEGGDVVGVVISWHLRGEDLTGQDVGPQRVHAAVGVAHAHWREGVAVIAAAPRHQPVLLRAVETAPVLQGHLHGDLDRDRPGVAEEDGVESVWGDLHQQLSEAGSRFVGEATEHDVVHPGQLGGDRIVECGVTVPVHGCPPGTHGVEHLDALVVDDQRQRRPARPYGNDGRHRLGAERTVGMPYVSGVDCADFSGGQRGHGKRA